MFISACLVVVVVVVVLFFFGLELVCLCSVGFAFGFFPSFLPRRGFISVFPLGGVGLTPLNTCF